MKKTKAKGKAKAVSELAVANLQFADPYGGSIFVSWRDGVLEVKRMAGISHCDTVLIRFDPKGVAKAAVAVKREASVVT